MGAKHQQRREVSLSNNDKTERRWRFVTLLLVVATVTSSFIGFVTPAAATASITSTFETDTDSWVTLHDGTLSYVATGGNPGGHLFAVDRGEGSWWYFQAPAKYLGDKSMYVGGSVSFDARQSAAFNDAPVYGDVVLVGTNGMALAYNFAAAPGTAWTAFEAPLVASEWTVANIGTAGGKVTYTQGSTTPTDAEFAAVVGDLAALYIRGEYRSGADSSGLDNVVLAPAPDDESPVIDAVVVEPSLVAGGASVDVTVSATDDVGVTAVTADGAILTQDATGNWTGTLTAPSTDGLVSVAVVAADAAGNTATATGSYVVDATPPVIDSVILVPSLVAGGGLVTVTVSASDANGVAGVTANGIALAQTATGAWEGTLTALSVDGGVAVIVSATDVVGNTASDASASYLVDVTPPTFDVTLTPTLVGPGAAVTVTVSASDANGVTGVTVDGVALTQGATGDWVGTLTAPSADGPVTVSVSAADVVGNTATSTESYTVDAIAPTITVITVAPDPVVPGGTVVVEATVFDANGVSLVTANGVTLTDTDGDGTWTGTLTAPTTGGPVTVVVSATDVVGNTATASSTSYLVIYPVTIDVNPQDVDNNVSTNGIIRVVIFGSDDISVAEIDYTSLRFGTVAGIEAGGGAQPAPVQANPTRDVNGDGRDDVTVQFRADESGLVPGDTVAVIVGSLTDGTPFRGTDAVTVEEPGNLGR